MNFVYLPGKLTPLKPAELANEANTTSPFKPFTEEMFSGPESRIQGTGHCDCVGNGEFELLPESECTDSKRYMRCRICGCYSHL